MVFFHKVDLPSNHAPELSHEAINFHFNDFQLKIICQLFIFQLHRKHFFTLFRRSAKNNNNNEI